MTYRIDEAEIRRACGLFMEPGQVTELRVLDCKLVGEWKRGTLSGYFDNVEALLTALNMIDTAAGVYYVPNPVKPALLARSYNRARIIADKAPTTTDRDILKRRWLLIDVDPVRPAGISSTDAEKAAAHQLITDIDYALWELGFPPGVFCDSGNGWHLLVPINMPADDGGAVKRILNGLAKAFDCEAAHVDTSVFNAARIWKLPGTLSCKGDDAPAIGRGWRMSKVGTVCTEVVA